MIGRKSRSSCELNAKLSLQIALHVMDTPSSAMDSKPTSSGGRLKKVKKKVGKKAKLEKARALAEKKKKEERDRELLEIAEMMKAETESRAYEREVKYHLEEKERREAEQSEMETLESEISQKRTQWLEADDKEEKWKRYASATRKVDPYNEADINTWMGQWRTRDVEPMPETLQTCQEAQDLVKEIERASSIEIAKSEDNLGVANSILTQFDAYLQTLRQLESSKIEQVTADYIQHADEHADSKNEVLLWWKTQDVKLGLWINISKNPRIKRLDFLGIGLTCEIPKSLALTSVAIRLMHVTNFDPKEYLGDHSLVPVGGILMVDLLALPPPPKKVKGWTLRQVTPLATSVQRMTYPPATGIGLDTTTKGTAGVGSNLNAGWPPLRISYSLPPSTIITTDNPQVCWWDAEERSWKSNGISEIEYDPATKTVVFSTMEVKPIAIIQNKFTSVPFQHWSLRPMGRDHARLTLQSLARNFPIHIDITEGWCQLSSEDDILKPLNGMKLQPAKLFQEMSNAGYHINISRSESSYFAESISIKDFHLERKLYRDISRMCPSFSFEKSKWNNQPDSERKSVFRVKESLGNSQLENSRQKASDWHACLYQERNCFLISVGEDWTKYEEELLNGAKMHQHLYHCLLASASSAESERKMKTASPPFVETVFAVLSTIQFLSFTV
eukprot:TRINITY_DN9739_c0_g1_i1.p1 TRINITY_DN9739_c0_g1~~TRINITY_DN9739_c0_g1_i1.p1  ORF type:complete len:675 (+),score=210.53 TRINITY_DN9739_c0_g1_i1:293-2317(+)